MSAPTPIALWSLPSLSSPSIRGWTSGLLGVLIAACLALMVAQSITDLRSIDDTVANRLSNSGRLVESTIGERFLMIRATLNRMDQVAEETRDGPARAQEQVVLLKRVSQALALLLPGAELALYRPDGVLMAETDPFIRTGIPGLAALLARRDAGYGTWLQPTTRGSGMLVLKPHWARNGTVSAVLVVAVPQAGLRDLIGRLALYPRSQVLLLDSSRRLLMRLPDAGAVENTAGLGGVVPPPPLAQAGGAAGGVIESPLDQVPRLTATRRLALPWSPGADYWILQYGHPVADYRAGWRTSAAINVVLSVMLLVLWYHLVRGERRKRALLGQALHASQLALQLVERMPAAVALVDRGSGGIAHANTVLRQRFGALAAPGQPVAGLFRDSGDWVALQRAGQMDALPMLGQGGAWLAQAQCSGMEPQDGPHYWLLSLLDVTELRERLARQQEVAMLDPLTGLANRRGYAERGAQLCAEAHRSGQPLAVLALDLDNFKRVNLRYGEAAGDVALVAVADLVREALGPQDVPARPGGEAFSVLMPGADLAAALQTAERIRQAVAGKALKMPDGQPLTLTISIGVTLLGPDETDLQAARERADAALYRAKNKGRDRCEAA